MCGRFSQSSKAEDVARAFGIGQAALFVPRYNIAPTQDVAAVRQLEPQQPRELARLRWGLIPAWAKDPSIGSRMINARCETVGEKPSFRDPFRKRRCLIVADGFYEWARTDHGKQPYYFYLREQQPFGFAGIWERWINPDGRTIQTCAILTTTANALVAPIHPRMPVIVSPDDAQAWLDPTATDFGRVLGPFPAERMAAHAVSQSVNNPANQGPDCTRPIDPG